MKHAYYSILFAVINPTTSERVSLGLLFIAANKVVYRWSKQKLSIVNKLLSKERLRLVQFGLKQIEETVNLKNQESDKLLPGAIDHAFSEQYLNYLSTYSQNTLQISGPEIIEAEYTDELFNLLFDKYIFQYPEEKHFIKDSEDERFEKVKNVLYPKIKTRVNTDIRISTDKIEKLIVPVELNFIGKNGNPVAGKFINFEKRLDFVHKEISDYVSLIKSFDLMDQKGKYFTIANEPSRDKKKNHQLWLHLRDIHIMDFVSTDETEIISDYVANNDVVPYFEIEESK